MIFEQKPTGAVSGLSEKLNENLLAIHKSREDRGEIWINGDIDNDVIETVVMKLLNFSQSGKFDKIVLFINSPGGIVSDGMAIVDTIAMIPTPVWTVNIGACYSMGLVTFLAGEKRFSMPFSSFMAHCMSYGLSGEKLYEHEEFSKFSAEEQKRHAEYFAKHSGKSAQFWIKKFRGADYWFNSEEAVKLGVATAVLDKTTYAEVFGVPAPVQHHQV
jgi:ATP-dependent Clp protease protease subunit